VDGVPDEVGVPEAVSDVVTPPKTEEIKIEKIKRITRYRAIDEKLILKIEGEKIKVEGENKFKI